MASLLYSENTFRYYVVPPIFLLFFTSIVQYLSVIGRGESLTWETAVANLSGNAAAWNWLVVVCLWAFYSLKVPSKTVLGPETPFGYRPTYQVSAGISCCCCLGSGRHFALDVGHIVGPLNCSRCDTKHRLPCTITPFY